MKRVTGLYLDYTTGVGSVSLAPEFKGQTAEFRAVAIGYWVAGLMSQRQEALALVTPEGRRTIKHSLDVQSIAQIMRDGRGILFLSDNKCVTKRKFMVTTDLFQPNVQCHKLSYTLWESMGYDSYKQLCQVPLRASSIKTVRRNCLAMHHRWLELQTLEVKTGGGRFGSARAYKHFTSDLRAYFLGEGLEGDDA